ncbi:tRNA (N(6)-L-threonylcarbamoyladenosine(37)-C(2))-methylthiotransferase MtaB [Thiocapsa bogorovii]|uniref:tRNA (N(6)-L-threonylcarbamoyladenosine(37)-C(2))- methylthiotransferase MtaB n=1 Tax=Thiocapsa bogorovii TaxID=521689 RepID=UPI001E2FEC14|nr:tRNA (N(6)-L-threonylcarbamoyladenosine(37)-C(2))-methylthiotransferase MtaB [Thiocapsa bogorovii]UHD18115.1 tRNA (N(6)-L-threonylcarbamoyladenosine(37)-C(2))-methylthiotransferase MtaB [Thiocapsa bogorovii]
MRRGLEIGPDRHGAALSLGRRVHITTLGCRLNEAESEEWAERFRDAGFRVVDASAPADLVVVNTCAVTQEAVRKSRGVLRRSQRANPGARLIVSGCLATLGDNAVSAETGVDLIVANRDKDRLVEIALATLNLPAMPETAKNDSAGALFARGRQRAFIKIQDGCRYSCTFCITTVARGAERSRTDAEIIGAIDRLVAQGIREVVLTGVHLGGYGSDSGSTLSDLIARILGETGIPRVRLGSLEPWDLGDAFWRNFEDPRLMPHLHLPLQSGSDPVLRRMARRCKTVEFGGLVEEGRARVPDLNITTDIIVGFPGESEEDWDDTLAFAESMRFGHIHAFAYSPRLGTRAAEMSGGIDTETKRRRLGALQDIGLRMREAILREQIGKTVEILCEGNPDGERRETRFGYTPNYLPVQVAARETAIEGNQLVEVVLSRLGESGLALVGQPIDPKDRGIDIQV